MQKSEQLLWKFYPACCQQTTRMFSLPLPQSVSNQTTALTSFGETHATATHTTNERHHNTLHNIIPQTQPQPTHTALQQSQRTTEMTMAVGRRRHGVVVAASGCHGRPSTSPCCCPRRPTGGGGPRSEGGSTAGCRRGDQGIAAVVTAALVQWAGIPSRGACGSGTCRVGPGGRASTPHAGP
jgi:hypothetical protein